MPELEKVIAGLEHCALSHKSLTSCDGCVYYAHMAPPCIAALAEDALALLKEQVPKMVIQTTSTIRCPGCGKQITNRGSIHKEIKYCWKCGQAVKWG